MCDDSAFRTAANQQGIDEFIRQHFYGVVWAFVFLGPDDFALSLPDALRGDSLQSTINKIADNAYSTKTMLTKDEFRGKLSNFKLRASQNVVLETGLIWGTLGFKGIKFISTFSHNDLNNQYDLPSDFPNHHILQLSTANMDTEIKTIVSNSLIDGGLHIVPYVNLLTDSAYGVNYRELFSGEQLREIAGLKSTHVDNEHKITHIEKFRLIADIWTREIQSLRYDDERIVYIFERLVFVPYFPKDHGRPGIVWMNMALQSIEDRSSEYYSILTQIRDYMTYRAAGNGTFLGYKYIADTLLAIKQQRVTGNMRTNPVINVYLNDYIGLSCRATVEEYKKDNAVDALFVPTVYLNHSIAALSCCIDVIQLGTSEAETLWKGYSLYNRARSYSLLAEYDTGNANSYKARSITDFFSALNVRYEWEALEETFGGIPKVFENSFIAEIALTIIEAIGKGIYNDQQKVEARDKLNDIYNMLVLSSSIGLGLVNNVKNKIDNLKTVDWWQS
ncbi:hypothetical protein JCM30204_41650 [Dysgonomonas termitidis]